MSTELLKTVYSSENFRAAGHELIDELADHLYGTLNEKAPKVIQWKTPEDEHLFWKEYLKKGSKNKLFPTILEHTTHVHHPKCIGHQVCPPAPMASLAGLISSLLNNGMAVYEMGMAPSAIERIITDLLCEKIGYDPNSRGFLTSGGSLANLTALLAARKVKGTFDKRNKGQAQRLGIMVCEEAHYCIDRAARIMGLEETGIIKIPVTNDFKLDHSVLESYYEKAKDSGIRVFAVIGSAPTTATGIYDDLEKLADFSERHQLWFHVDAAHGGAAIFSPKYQHTVRGISRADSVAIDGHKMMMMPVITTALLFKNGNFSYSTFSQKADYLLIQSQGEDWYNLAKRTFECTKTMMGIQWYTLLKLYGEKIFDEYVTTLYDLGYEFGEIIKKDHHFELAITPKSNIVCFRYVDDALDITSLNKLNKQVRQQLIEEGKFYIVQTTLRNRHYLRTTIMNPFTTALHFRELLRNIRNKVDVIRRIEFST